MTKQQHRNLLVKLLSQLDDEAFSWVAMAMLPHAAMYGAHAQIWPDGVGGFNDSPTITAARQEAAAYLGVEVKS